MANVGLFTNLKSGKNKIDFERYGQNRRLKKLRNIISDEGEVYVTGNSINYLDELENKIKRACKDKPDVIAIDGGDWTISTVLTTLDKYWCNEELPPIALLEGGTFNNLSKRLGIKKPFEYLQEIVDTKDTNDLMVQGLRMMGVNDDFNRSHLSFSAGVGFPVNMLEEIYRFKSLKYVWVVPMFFRAIGSAIINSEYHQRFNKKTKMIVTGEGNGGSMNPEYKENEWLGVLAQSMNSLGIPKWLPQPEIFKKAESEGRFQAVATDLDFRKLLRHAPSIYAGEAVKYKDPETSEYSQVLDLNKQLKSLKIQSEEPFRYQSCGELSYGNEPFLTRELNIDSGKNINFIKEGSPDKE